MIKWEYIIEQTDKGDIWLNKMGAEGWELCAVESVSDFVSRYFFKRPINPHDLFSGAAKQDP